MKVNWDSKLFFTFDHVNCHQPDSNVLPVPLLGTLTTSACLCDAEGPHAGVLYDPHSVANRTSLKQLQNTILINNVLHNIMRWCLLGGHLTGLYNRQPSGTLHFVLRKGLIFLILHFTTKMTTTCICFAG